MTQFYVFDCTQEKERDFTNFLFDPTATCRHRLFTFTKQMWKGRRHCVRVSLECVLVTWMTVRAKHYNITHYTTSSSLYQPSSAVVKSHQTSSALY